MGELSTDGLGSWISFGYPSRGIPQTPLEGISYPQMLKSSNFQQKANLPRATSTPLDGTSYPQNVEKPLISSRKQIYQEQPEISACPYEHKSFVSSVMKENVNAPTSSSHIHQVFNLFNILVVFFLERSVR